MASINIPKKQERSNIKSECDSCHESHCCRIVDSVGIHTGLVMEIREFENREVQREQT